MQIKKVKNYNFIVYRLDKCVRFKYNINIMDTKTKNKKLFFLLLSITFAVLAIAITLIVFSFISVESIGIMQALYIGISMIAVLVMTIITVIRGLIAFRE